MRREARRVMIIAVQLVERAEVPSTQELRTFDVLDSAVSGRPAVATPKNGPSLGNRRPKH